MSSVIATRRGDQFTSEAGVPNARSIVWIEEVTRRVNDANNAIDALDGNNYVEVTSAYTSLATDDVINCISGTFTVTLIAAASATTGRKLYIKNSGTGEITVDASGSENIDGSLTLTLTPDDSFTIVSTGSNWIIL